MPKSEIHIIKDEKAMMMKISGSLIDVTKMFGQAIEESANKYEIDVEKLCALITECAKAHKMYRYLEDEIKSGKISETVAIAFAEAYFKKRTKVIDELKDKENKRGV